MSRFLLTIALLGGWICAAGQSSPFIRIEAEATFGDTLFLARWNGDQIHGADTLRRTSAGGFLFTSDTLLSVGMYSLVRPGSATGFLFFLSEREQRFDLRLSGASAAFNDAPENERYRRFDDYLERRLPELRNLSNALRYLGARGEDTRFYQEQLLALQLEIDSYAKELIDEDSTAMAAALIRARRVSALPLPTLQELPALQGDPRIYSTPVFFAAVSRLMATYAGTSGDSLSRIADTLLTMMADRPQTQAWYLRHFLDQFAPRGPLAREAAFVHLVDRFLRPKPSPFFPEEDRRQWMLQADRLSPLLVGRIPPALRMPTLDIPGTLQRADEADERKRFTLDTEIDILQVDAAYTLLFFWKPDCSHCLESMPRLVDLYRRYRPRGLEVVAVCYGDYWSMPDCARALSQSQAVDWINAVDPYLRSRFLQKYNVTSTPSLFLLDAGKEILAKNIELDQLAELLDHLIR